VPESGPNPELLSSLGRLVRGLSALFWGIPVALVACVQTAKSDWLRPFGVFPALITTGLLYYGLTLLESFQQQERVWHVALPAALSAFAFALSAALQSPALVLVALAIAAIGWRTCVSY